jgi:hypothetical protein
MIMTLTKINNMLPEDGCSAETCRSNFGVKFNVHFNVLLNKYTVRLLVKTKKTLIVPSGLEWHAGAQI